MHPAFRSKRSAVAFCVLLAFLLSLPVLLSRIGPPSREQNFISMSNNAGPVGFEAAEIYDSPGDTDVVIVGSSRVLHGIRPEIIQKGLSAHLGRPASVAVLAINWPGEDMHSYVLRDYLEHHHTRLILWNMPQAKAFNNQPHVQADHWMIYGKHEGDLSRLPVLYRPVLYGEMVFGAPRELLSKLRPNLVADDEKKVAAYNRQAHDDPEHKAGLMGAPFVADSLPGPSPDERYLVPVTSPTLKVTGPAPGPYQIRFIQGFAGLAKQYGTTLVLLHLPEVDEFGEGDLPEIASWSRLLGPNYELIGAPGKVLFAGIDRERELHFYSDDLHFNDNGATWFSEKIVPSIIEAYDRASQ